jgi:hypothetical protein
MVSINGVLVQPDDDCSCGERVAVIEAPVPPHAGSLVCSTCGKHRGWLPRHAYNFVTEIINKFGRPTEPIAYRRGPTSSTEGTDMKKFDNTNRGALFKEETRKTDSDPDYSGTINVNGTDYWLKGWIKTATKSGKKFLSLSARPKQQAEDKQHRGVSRINRIECLAIRSGRGVSRSTDKTGTSGPYRRIDPLIRRMSNTGHRRGERLEVSLPRSPTLTFDSDTAHTLKRYARYGPSKPLLRDPQERAEAIPRRRLMGTRAQLEA